MSISHPLFAEWILRGLALSLVGIAAYSLFRPGDKARGTLLVVTTVGLLLLPLALITAPRLVLGWIPLSPNGIQPMNAPTVGTVAGLNWIFVVWLTGTALVLARIALGNRALTRFLSEHSGTPVDGHVLRSARRAAHDLGITVPQIRYAKDSHSPFATGLIRPQIVLPADAASWSPVILRAVLLHEMAHIRRGDLWIQAAGNLVCALYWFNPLAWFLHRRLAGEREFLADALVVACGTDAKKYAHALLDVADSVPQLPVGRGAAIGLTGAFRLEDRIRRIVGKGSSTGNRTSVIGAVIISITAVAASACLDPFAQAPDLPTEPTDAEEREFSEASWTKEEIETRLSASPFPAEN